MSNCKGARVVPSVTVSGNYNRLVNKPKINGVELSGDMSASELNLLTNNMQSYETLTLGEMPKPSYVIVVSAEGQPSKVALDEVTSGKFLTTDNVEDIDVGNYLFKKVED